MIDETPTPASSSGNAPTATGAPAWEDQEIPLMALLAVVLRHRWKIVAITLFVPLVVGMVTLLWPRTWTASTSFMPQAPTDAARSQIASLAGQFGFDVGGMDAGQTPDFYADLIRSREVLGQVVRDTFEVADTLGLFASGDRLHGTPPEILELEPERPRLQNLAALEWLLYDALSVSTSRTTGVIALSVTTPWPELSNEIAERIVELVNQFNLETRQSQAAAERRFLEARLEETRSDLRAAEQQLQEFLQANRRFQDAPELVFQRDRLQREVNTRQQMYMSLEQSYEQARVAEVRNTPVITVIEQAEVPVRPDRRHTVLKVALALIFGLLLGVAVAFLWEYIRQKRARGDQDFEEVTGLWRETKADLARFIPHRKK